MIMANAPKKLKRHWVPERKPFQKSMNDNSKFYNSWPWRKLRKIYREKNPYCVKCEAEGRVTAMHVVDHIVRIEDGGSSLDEDNLQSLCKFHHNQKSGREAHGYREQPSK